MAALPADIIADILSRLPVKSLLLFKCVSKSWYSLIKSPNFIKLHHNQSLISNSNRHLLLFDTSLRCADFDLHPNHLSFSELRHPLRPGKVHIYGSCNGVVCISDDKNNDIFLYNPLTKSHRKLPSNPITNLEYYSMMLGFGYDSKSDDYKVLRIVQEQKPQSISYNEATLYSLNNNSWKHVEGISYCLSDALAWRCVEGISYLMIAEILDNDTHGVLVNEALHYLVFDQKSDYSLCESIASFDLRNVKFSYMDCPDYQDDQFSDRDMRLRLSELGGCLCQMVVYSTTEFDRILGPDSVWRQICDTGIMFRVDLWAMKEYGKKESWVKLFSIRQAEPVWCARLMNTMIYSKDGRRILLHIDNIWFWMV